MTKFKDIIFESNVVIHCPEEWMANELLKYADSKGYDWCIGESYLNSNCWHTERQNTVYFLETGTYSNIDHARKSNYEILHYNDVVIKEGEEMETKLDYELWIKGRKTEVGSKLWLDNGDEISKVTIDKILIYQYQSPQVRLRNEKNKYTFFRIDDLEFIDKRLFWEKPIKYQLPDTEGNLSEVKVGQPVWLQYEGGVIYDCFISNFNSNNIEIMFICDNEKVYVSNKEGLTLFGGKATTNKPSRFRNKQDWSQAPEKAMCWAIDEDGRSYWFEGIPRPDNYMCWGSPDVCYIAGYRNDLIDDRENMKVTDWKDSLVMRPKNINL